MQSKTYIKLLILVVLLGGFVSYKNYISKGVNLAQSENWTNFPGAKATSQGIHFKPLERILIHQDGSVGQPNPPVNLSGAHLLVKGDFSITATLLNIDKQASFRLYSSPPIVFDQWRQETQSIDINIDKENNFVTARIWDGSSSNSMDIRTSPIFLKGKTIISIQHIKNQINIVADNKMLLSIPDHNIFSGGQIWFGADGVAGSSGWTLAELTAQKIKTGSVKIAPVPLLIVDQNDKNSLRNLADANSHKIKIGSAVAVARLFTDKKYKELALSQFSMITPENSMKPQFIHPEANTYSFEEADLLVDIASKNKIIVHGHVLVYEKSSPDWMTNSPVNQRQEIMVSHIKNVVSHFKGRVAEWDVVNEPFSYKNALYKNWGTGLEKNIWFEAMGEKYIDIAFKTAREADSSAKLYLNEYGVENDGQRWDAFLSLIKRLKERGVPIDGVGFESHVYGDGDYINSDQFKKHMEILVGLGLLTRISEIDVTGDDSKEQTNQYVTALDVCLKESNCTSYTTWGITDLYGSTTRSDRYPLVYGTSLLWDKEMKAKPAYTALQNRLQK